MVAMIGLALTIPTGRGARAQQDPPVIVDSGAGVAPGLEPTPEPGDGTSRKPGQDITPLLVPIPFKNTQVGWGLALMAGAIHRFDPDTTLKPSTGMAGGFYTENGSWGLMAVEMARLQGDAWRLRAMLSHFSVRYDFYGVGEDAGEAGRSIPLQQEMDFVYVSALRRLAPRFYLGPTVLWMRTSVELREPPGSAIEPLPEDLARSDLVAPGIDGEFDSRDDDYWPTSGSYAKLRGSFYSDALGSSRTFQRYLAAWSWYSRTPAVRTILAANVNVAGAAGDVPFYALPSIGAGRFPLRGYTQGRYRDRVMTTVQVEVRHHLENRLGATAFAGFGQVAPDAGAIFEAQVLAAGGLGVRYQLARQYPMHMRLDYAWGRDGGLFYFSVGEAF